MLLTALLVSAQGPTCRDSDEHRRLQGAMWEVFGGDSTNAVYNAAKVFQAHARADGDYDSYYQAWICGITYALDHMNIRDAYHIVQTMTEDLKHGMGGEDEQFLAPNMLGQVYSSCGNIQGAITEFNKAVELIKGTKYEASNLSTLYLGMAHIYINSRHEEAQYWIDQAIEEQKRYPDKKRTNRNLADYYAFKAMICFKQKDYDRFWQCQRLSADYEKHNISGSSGSFLPYLAVYQKTLEGRSEEALQAADSLANRKDGLIVKCDVLRYLGKDDKAFNIQRQLMFMRDSIMGVTIAENIEKMDAELQLVRAEQTATKRANYILTALIAIALLLVASLIFILFARQRHQRQLMQKNRELTAAHNEVIAADEMKMEFIRNVSHEIRTPLNIINGFAHVLTDGETVVEQKEREEIADTISENTHQITSLVNKMLALANESTKNLLKDVSEVDAAELCRQAIATMPFTDPAKIKVAFDNRLQGADAKLCTNGKCLSQMLGNILENAVKFTEKGTIRLSLSKDEACFHFTVEDTGCGISADKVDTIFDRFVKLDEFKEGLGIGLAYCHEVAQKLGGDLRLDHTSEAGTSFTLSLPTLIK